MKNGEIGLSDVLHARYVAVLLPEGGAGYMPSAFTVGRFRPTVSGGYITEIPFEGNGLKIAKLLKNCGGIIQEVVRMAVALHRLWNLAETSNSCPSAPTATNATEAVTQ